MAVKVFISHSSKDREIADAICRHLESMGVSCWIAHRDIEPGADWTQGILKGIASSRLFVLVFSRHANDSEHVQREVGRACSLQLPVLPFRTEAVEPRNSLEYFLQTVHWFDATTAPLEQHLPVLAERVKALLNGTSTVWSRENSLEKGRTFIPGASARNNTGRRLLPAIGLIGAAIVAAGIWFFVTSSHQPIESGKVPMATVVPAKSIAVLPFESLSEDKQDVYFADGVQDEILNDLAKIAQLTVISRTSVMQYRAGEKRDVRQVANALGVANVLEGTVRRSANRVRISTELIDAREDKTIWADSFDRDLTDIFAIQSEVAQTIATKLTATLSPDEKRNIEKKPTENLAAYELYLQAKELLVSVGVAATFSDVQKPLAQAVSLLEQAVQLDPKFTLAYCRSAEAHDLFYRFYDPTPEQRALGDAAISRALALEPDLAEVHLAYAFHLYRGYRDYDQTRLQLALAKRGLPNDAEAAALEAYVDRRQGHFEKAIQEFKDAITHDPRNSVFVEDLAITFQQARQFRSAEQTFDRLTALLPNQAIVATQKPILLYYETGDTTAVRTAFAALPALAADDRGIVNLRLAFAFFDRDWTKVKALLEKMNSGDDEGDFAYGGSNVPLGCYSILLARLQGEQASPNPSFAETRDQLNERVQKQPENAKLLSQLAVIDALLGQKELAISEAKRAVELLPISEDAVDGPYPELNLAVVYAWTNEFDLAFETLTTLSKVPNGLYNGPLKREPYWEPLRHDPRYEKLLADLAPKE
ncbi:MAG TPA: TIR domain-containing protein [Chthoniobacterales bacterium]|nr:TIR domain-containing protein [Chthoniobacterales bacterium]